MNKRQAILKKLKKVIILDITAISLVSLILLTSLGIEKVNSKNIDLTDTDAETTQEEVVENDITEAKEQVRSLQQLRQVKMHTYTNTFKDEDGVRREYICVNEEEVVDLSREFSVAIEDYFKSCGASNWTNDDLKQFWPEDIEYMVTAIAYRESTYRTNISNDLGCSGLTCLNKVSTLNSLGQQWLVPRIWGDKVPQINCNPEEVDVLNPTTSIEYTYYNIGYNLANRLKKDKYFIDTDGTRRSIWQVLDYSEETQNRLLIAMHLFGINNVTDAVFGNKIDSETGKKVSVEQYIYSDYVEDVLNKMYELKNTYEQGLEH